MVLMQWNTFEVVPLVIILLLLNFLIFLTMSLSTIMVWMLLHSILMIL